MLRGLSTVNFFADDLAAAQAWYADVLGIDAYFVREVQGAPAYVEFRIGDYLHELGIIDSRFARGSREPGGALIYWHVDDVQGTSTGCSRKERRPSRNRSNAVPASSRPPSSTRSATSSA